MGYFLNESTIVNIAHQLKDSKKEVIFTHGYFDLFHAGHSYFLNASKKHGDILIVGIDTDEKVAALKGMWKPIISQDQRIEILLNHTAVDFVFLIGKINRDEEKYYFELYEELLPTKVTFGRNFNYKNQFAKPENKIRGTSYVEIPKVFKNAPSTTAIIEKIKSI